MGNILAAEDKAEQDAIQQIKKQRLPKINDIFTMKIDPSNCPLLQREYITNNITHICSGFRYTIYCNHDTQTYFSEGANQYNQCVTSSPNLEYQKALSSILFFKRHNIKIKNVFANSDGSSTFWLTDNYEIYGNGRNDYGQLGLNQDEYLPTQPAYIAVLSNRFVIDIKSNGFQSIALSKIDINILPVLIQSYYGCIHGLIADDVINIIIKYYGFCSMLYVTKKQNGWTPIDAAKCPNIIKIEGGINYFVILKSDGTVWIFSSIRNILFMGIRNDNGNLKIIDIACHGTTIFMVNEHFNVMVTEYYALSDMCLKSPVILSMNQWKIIEIQCGKNQLYMKRMDNQHFLINTNQRMTGINKWSHGEVEWMNARIGKEILKVSVGACDTKVIASDLI